jgi:hypothetical protein
MLPTWLHNLVCLGLATCGLGLAVFIALGG